jgi:multiple sugar transport system ATP-binding protein
MSMGDKIAIMYGGLLQQVGTPTEVYDYPRNLFVAGFIGSPAMNLLPVHRQGNALAVSGTDGYEGASFPIEENARGGIKTAPEGTDLLFGIRPEDISLVAPQTPGTLDGEAIVVEPLGPEKIVNERVAGHVVKARTLPTFPARVGEKFGVRFDQNRGHLFNKETTEALTRMEAVR